MIKKLAALLLADKVEPNSLFDLLGQPSEKTEKRWHIEPATAYEGAIAAACLHIEKLRTSTGLITTVQLRLANPWRTTLLALQHGLGSMPRELPLPPATIVPGGPYEPPLLTFAYDIERERRLGVVMVTARTRSDDCAESEIDILEIRVRRYYD